MRNVISILLRFFWLWLFNALCLQLCDWLIQGFVIHQAETVPLAVSTMSVALIFTFANLLIRPLILLLTIPLNTLSFGLFSLVVNAGMFYIVAEFSKILILEDFTKALLASFLFAIVNFFLTMLIPIDEDLLYYDILGNREQRNQTEMDFAKKGIVLLEIDGLSYSRIVNAIRKRAMPYLKELTDSGRYVVSHYDCGIPSQTSSCQAGIMFGNNENICAFRWYDKENRKVITSNNFNDMNRVEKNILEQNPYGLLNDGISINNLMSGNAAVSLFTVSSIRSKNEQENRQRNLNFYSYSLKPFMLTKSLIFTLMDIFEEVFQYLWAVIKNKTPRLNRLHRFYPVLRAITNVLLRDISTSVTINEIHHNSIASYTTFYGYDEIAHHSGPDSWEAYRALRKIDRSIKRIHHSAERISGRPYEVFVLSDHGQSFGATFRQRYNISLSDYIRQLARNCSIDRCDLQVVSVENTADNNASIRAAITTLIRKPDSEETLSIRNQTADKINYLLETTENGELESDREASDGNIWVMASGNLANVYFLFAERKILLEEIEEKYPNFCGSLVEHPGIGLIIVHTADAPRAIGKSGIRNLVTGEIIGQDPLLKYGDPEIRAEQLRYLADFSNGGDLIVFSSVYNDGTVAAFEELIGSHGGMGGDQTNAFIFHQADIPIPDGITNANQVFPILNERRNQPAEKIGDSLQTDEKAEWKFSSQIEGIKNTGKWTVLIRDILLYQTDPYRRIAEDPSLNGPTLMISAFSFLITMAIFSVLRGFPNGIAIGAVLWFVSTFLRVFASVATMLVLREPLSGDKFLRALMANCVFEIFWLGLLIPGAEGVWVILMFANRFITSVLSLIGYSNASRRKSLLIVIVFFLAGIAAFVGINLILTSLGYILNFEPLIQFMQNINRNNSLL